MVFLDEAAGYLPPHPKSPPSKGPLLTLMKQARAVGLGVVVSTQNPVDLDYKALSNAGTWCIGRLTTKQDRDRLLKGLDATGLDGTVAKLKKRQFVLHQIGRGAPEVLASRHAIAYLRGPLTAPELGRLNADWGVEAPASVADPEAAGGAADPVDDDLLPRPPLLEGTEARFLDPRVVFSAKMDGFFADHAEPARKDGAIVFAPALRAEVDLRFDETKGGFVLDETLVRMWFPLDGRDRPESPVPVVVDAEDLLDTEPEAARFRSLPEWLDTAAELKKLAKTLKDEVYRTEARGQFVNAALKLHASHDESEEDFRTRCEAEVEARIDARAAKLRDKYEKAAERLEDRLATKRARLAETAGVARSRQLEEVVNLGATVLSFFGGRKKSLTSTVTKRRQSAQAAARRDRLEDEIARLEEDAVDLENKLADDLEEIRETEGRALDEIEQREVGLERSDVGAPRLEIVWVPVTRRI